MSLDSFSKSTSSPAFIINNLKWLKITPLVASNRRFFYTGYSMSTAHHLITLHTHLFLSDTPCPTIYLLLTIIYLNLRLQRIHFYIVDADQ